MPNKKKVDWRELTNPILVEMFHLLKEEYEKRVTTHSLVVTESHRSVDRQQKLYAQGRSTDGPVVTQIDGIRKMGNHNYLPARAIDVAVVRKADGKVTWNHGYYRGLGEILQDIQRRYPHLRSVGWGGWWKKFVDLPHFELKA